nr:hypothetical protein [Tanacetum cinerariifolium]
MIAILEKLEHNVNFHQIVDFVEASHIKYALTINPTVYVSHIKQFWSTARIETSNEGTKILATVDGKPMTIFESSIRRNLKLNNEEGISTLLDIELFENLALMGYNILPNQKFTFQKAVDTQALMHDPVEWRLYDICGVHHVFTRDQEIFMLVEKDYPLRKGLGSRSNLENNTIRECTFAGFMKCGLTQFHGNEGAVELCRWFKKTKSVFGISNCAERSKKSWNDMKKMTFKEFYPSEEIQRLENELRSLKLRDTNITAYTQRFNDLAILCPEAVPSEKKKVKLYIKGLLENIKGETNSSRLAVLNDVVRVGHFWYGSSTPCYG